MKISTFKYGILVCSILGAVCAISILILLSVHVYRSSNKYADEAAAFADTIAAAADTIAATATNTNNSEEVLVFNVAKGDLLVDDDITVPFYNKEYTISNNHLLSSDKSSYKCDLYFEYQWDHNKYSPRFCISVKLNNELIHKYYAGTYDKLNFANIFQCNFLVELQKNDLLEIVLSTITTEKHKININVENTFLTIETSLAE